MEKRLVVLLVEDDLNTCEMISNYIQGQEDMELAGVTNNSSDAIQYVKDTLPDAVILDLELHNGGGNGLLFLNDLNKLRLRKHPYILVTTNNSSNITLQSARKMGADFILAKYESNYTPQYAVDFLSHIRESILTASPAIESSFQIEEAPKEMEKRLIRRIHRELDLIGVSPKVIGYKYLTDAILMIIQNPSTNISQILGNKYKKSNSSVERAMQNAINRTWNSADTDTLLLNCYTAHINPERGMPTINEFIYYYAKKITDES